MEKMEYWRLYPAESSERVSLEWVVPEADMKDIEFADTEDRIGVPFASCLLLLCRDILEELVDTGNELLVVALVPFLQTLGVSSAEYCWLPNVAPGASECSTGPSSVNCMPLDFLHHTSRIGQSCVSLVIYRMDLCMDVLNVAVSRVQALIPRLWALIVWGLVC
jgi:hypothetical protein